MLSSKSPTTCQCFSDSYVISLANESEQESPLDGPVTMRTKPVKPPLSPVRPKALSSLSIKPPIVITKGPKGIGFTLKAIRVYLGSTNNYTVHHLVKVTNIYFLIQSFLLVESKPDYALVELQRTMNQLLY